MPIFVICGVSGSGKSTIGRALAADLNCPFVEGDDFHPKSNVEKMSSGTPLTDENRVDWLIAIGQHVNSLGDQAIVLACSALTPFVQSFLKDTCNKPIHWIKMQIDLNEVRRRMDARSHFMPSTLAQSQFEAWVPPKTGLNVDAANTVQDTVRDIRTYVETLT